MARVARGQALQGSPLHTGMETGQAEGVELVDVCCVRLPHQLAAGNDAVVGVSPHLCFVSLRGGLPIGDQEGLRKR